MTIWVEKYRPRNRNDIAGNKETIDSIFACVDSGNMTSMIFNGSAGIGKTSTVKVIARKLFGENIQPNFLDLNASDERGIEVVQTTIKQFAKNSPFQAQFKLIGLDESDQMTPPAQEALRRIMEDTHKVTRFIFSTNRLEKLIEPIQSRCQIFHFGPISIKDISDRLSFIYLTELGLPTKIDGQTIPDERITKIAELSHGDMRKAINQLQMLMSVNPSFTLEMVEKVRPVDYSKLILESLKAGHFLEARKKLTEALELGYRERYIIDAMHLNVVSDSMVSTKAKESIIFILAEGDYRLTLGVSPLLLMDSILLKIIGICKEVVYKP